MSDQQTPGRSAGPEAPAPFEELLGSAPAASPETSFTTVFRGYDKDEVDSAISRLATRVRADSAEISFLEERYRRVSETAGEQSREAAERIQAEADAKVKAAEARNRENLERFQAKLTAANARAAKAEQSAQDQIASATGDTRETIERLEAELTAATARATKAESRVKTLTDELVDAGGESGNRPQRSPARASRVRMRSR